VQVVDPLGNTYINAVGENAWFGWPLDDELIKLRRVQIDRGRRARRLRILAASRASERDQYEHERGAAHGSSYEVAHGSPNLRATRHSE